MHRPIVWIVTLPLAAPTALRAAADLARVPSPLPAAAAPRPSSRTPSPRPQSRHPEGSRNREPDKPRPTLALQVGHSGPISSIAFSPDGKTLATTSQDNTGRLWDVASGHVKAILEGLTAPITVCAYSPDGGTLATGGSGNSVRMWDARSGQLLRTLYGHGNFVRMIEFSPNGKTLVSVADDARLWDARSGRLKQILRGVSGSVGALAFSRDSRILAVGRGGQQPRSPGEVQLWDTKTEQLRTTLRGHVAWISALVFSRDGGTLAAGTGGNHPFGSTEWTPVGEVRLWDLHTGQLKRAFRGLAGGVQALAFSPDDRILAAGSGYSRFWYENGQFRLAKAGEARLWDARTGAVKASLPGEGFPVTALAFSPEGTSLVIGYSWLTAQLWDVRTGQLRATLQGPSGSLDTFAFSPDGRTLATGGADGIPRLWDARNGQLRSTFQGQFLEARALAFSPDARTLATGGRALRLWDAETGQLKMTLRGTDGQMGANLLAFSPDGKIIATWTGSVGRRSNGDGTFLHFESNEMRLWDALSGQLKTTLTWNDGQVEALAFSPDGKTLATGSRTARIEKTGDYRQSGPVRLWDVPGGQLKAMWEAGGVSRLVFSPDGRMLATGGYKEARLWDVERGQLKAALRGHTDGVTSLAFSPDGQTLASGAYFGEARLWSLPGGQLKATLTGHNDWNHPFAFSRDSKTLAMTDATMKARLWDVTTGRQIPLSPQIRFPNFPSIIQRPAAKEGTATRLHDPRDGRLLATLLPIPELDEPDATGLPIVPEGKPIDVGAKPAPLPDSDEWFASTPEGYFDCSTNAARFVMWNVNGVLYPAERYLRRFRRPDLVRRALRGERITAPELSANDIPPAAQFVGLRNGDLAPGDPLTVTVEARDDQDVKEVELLVNGRPLPPGQARPIEVGAKPIEVGAKEGDPHHRLAKRFTFRFALPLGAEEIQLRAIAYDSTDLGSDPVEIVLKRPGIAPVARHLYVLAVGVGHYQNVDGQRLRDLQFPAADARAIAARFQREGRPLYEQVHVRTLTDEQATLANVRAGLKWLQESVRPGQVDTVVLFLSGHGISTGDGRYYYFATHDLDLQNIAGTSLSSRELREALGGRLQARPVFLFVDTCHAGGLNGSNDDLAQEVGEGVYILASSGARESSYESPTWGHGAFTLALLRSLGKKELEDDGAIRFIDLTGSVRREVKALMQAAGRNASEQEPCVPIVGRRLGEPVARAAP